MEKYFVLFFMFLLIGCTGKNYMKQSELKEFPLDNSLSKYKIRTLVQKNISKSGDAFKHQVAVRNSWYEPTPVDEFSFKFFANETLKNNNGGFKDDVKLRYHNGVHSVFKKFRYVLIDGEWFLNFYIGGIGKQTWRIQSTEAGMQEFERVVEQLECQKKERVLLND